MPCFRPYAHAVSSTLIELNRQLDSVCLPHLVNEAWLADFYIELSKNHHPRGAYFWLLFARMMEAALVCAGHYADNCEYSAAGDLLVNPRCIKVYSKNTMKSKLKDRHRSIPEQFNNADIEPELFRKAFCASKYRSIEEDALLPTMADIIHGSGVFSRSFLRSMDERMKKIAHTIGFLLSWSIDDATELHRHQESATPVTQDFINQNLCRFNLKVFEALGTELKCMEHDINLQSWMKGSGLSV